jgi:TonB family protein
MFFNFEGRNFDTPTVESVMSWREQLMGSLFAHLAAVLLLVFVPRLSFIQEAAERRAERLAQMAELAEVEQQALLQERQEDPTFVFVAPRVDAEADEPPAPDVRLSDRDRVARSPLLTLDPDNNLPVADGNSTEFVEADDPSDELDPILAGDVDNVDAKNVLGEDDIQIEPDELRLAEMTPGDSDTDESVVEPTDDPGARLEDLQGVPRLAESSLPVPGSGPGDPDDQRDDVRDIESDGLLGQVRETLRRSIDQQSYGNISGDTGRYGPEIQFDTKGVEFGPWIRRFVAQIRRNWFIPYSVLTNHGHVVLTFHVHRDGSVTDLAVQQPSRIDSFNQSASNALRSSNPTQPLPAEYPDDKVLFTVTFYFNEAPPGRF